MPLSTARGFFWKRSACLAPVLTAALLACALSACSKGGNAEGEAQAKSGDAKAKAIPVEVADVSRRPVAASYTGTAPLEARGESQVIAKTSGVALKVLAEVGQMVQAGQALVRLDSDRARLAVAQAEAQMHKLENSYRRSQQLVAQQMISVNDVDQIKYDLENIRAQHRLALLELSYATVKAPISGVIASRSIKDGNFVQINTPIFRIVDTSQLEATLNVPERELATMKAGLPVALQVDALPGKTFSGKIDRVAPVVDSGSGTFRVVAAFDSGGQLQPGMFGRIGIDYDRRANALVVPRNALLEGENDPAVFVARAGKVTRTPVKLGYLDGEWAEIRGGLKLGDKVVVAGKSALRDGSAVQVVGPDKGGKQVAANGSGNGKSAPSQSAPQQ